jgi:DNA-binding transcriptional MerR regulator
MGFPLMGFPPRRIRSMSAVLSPAKYKPLRIGQVAARTGRSVHAIRWYETQGLIPGVTRDPGGRRVYGERHLGWLTLIDRLRLTGMSIAQVRAYAALISQGRGTLKQQLAMLQAHRAQVEQTITEWTAAMQMVEQKIAGLEEWIATGQRPTHSHSATVAPARKIRTKRRA